MNKCETMQVNRFSSGKGTSYFDGEDMTGEQLIVKASMTHEAFYDMIIFSLQLHKNRLTFPEAFSFNEHIQCIISTLYTNKQV